MSTAEGAEPEPETDDGYGFEKVFNVEVLSDRELRMEVVGPDDRAPGSAAGRKRRREDDTGTSVLRVETKHVSSAILAAQSNFFFKLFSNGMKESGQRQATVRIDDSEYNAFMELLNFMHSGKFTPTEPTLLVDILMAADKFEAVSCMKLCGQRLIDLPMTAESAVRCLDLPCSISMAADLSEAAKKFLAKRYEKFLLTKFQDELMRIPLTGIITILSRNHPGVAYEESVYEFILRWAHFQYPNSEERHKILSSSLLPLVPLARRMANAILIGQTPCLIEQPSCIMNFSLKREHCSGLVPSAPIYSPPFYCAGHAFFLSAHRRMEPSDGFLLLVRKLEDKWLVLVRGTMYYEIDVKTTPSMKFAALCRRTTTTDCRLPLGCRIPWPEVFADDCRFFIDDKLHVQVHVKITPQP